MGDSYQFQQSLAGIGSRKFVVFKGNLEVKGNFSSAGPARFFKDVMFRGGVEFKVDPLVERIVGGN